MEKIKQHKMDKSDSVPTPIIPTFEIGEQDWSPNQPSESYVVIRGGIRVSDNEYLTPDYPQAISEKEFWQKIVNQYPDGTKVEIVQYDKKKHRIW